MAKEFKPKYGKVLHRFEKPKGKIHCLLQEDADDNWFIYSRKIDTKTGQENDRAMIIQKDLAKWIQGLEEYGWIEKEI
jgi:hypothetical protein